MREAWGAHGRIHCTILDLLSLANDPGGMSLRDEATPNWRAQRGPLHPFSDAAVVLYDFGRAMKRDAKLGLEEQVIVALQVFGFTHAEIGAVLGIKQQRVSRILQGRILKDRDGRTVIDADTGDPARRGGIVGKLTAAMNGTAA